MLKKKTVQKPKAKLPQRKKVSKQKILILKNRNYGKLKQKNNTYRHKYFQDRISSLVPMT
jgi:hypothetical protein